MRRTRRGTNQFEVKEKTNMGYLVYLVILFLGFALIYNLKDIERWYDKNYNKTADANFISPLVASNSAETKKEITPTPTLTQYQVIDNEIKEVFGKHYDKAKKILSCENASLNPSAVNTAGNYPEGSRDMGIFQVNEFWQGVNAKFLLNYKTNIRIAYQIFEDSGYSFRLWSCSRKVGVE